MFAYPINPLDVSVSDRIEEVKILRELCDILDVYGQKYWLDSGTLLGAFREGKILGHDADIDISRSMLIKKYQTFKLQLINCLSCLMKSY